MYHTEINFDGTFGWLAKWPGRALYIEGHFTTVIATWLLSHHISPRFVLEISHTNWLWCNVWVTGKNSQVGGHSLHGAISQWSLQHACNAAASIPAPPLLSSLFATRIEMQQYQNISRLMQQCNNATMQQCNNATISKYFSAYVRGWGWEEEQGRRCRRQMGGKGRWQLDSRTLEINDLLLSFVSPQPTENINWCTEKKQYQNNAILENSVNSYK